MTAAHAVHEPLSCSLARLASEGGIRTLNDLVVKTGGRGIFLATILLCLPFITPIPLPGLSNIVGLALMVVAVRQFQGSPARLPAFLGARPWPAERMQQVLKASLKFVSWLEKLIRPRRTQWLTASWATRWNAFVFGVMALLLALPIPPIMPFSNAFPAYAIILLSAALMEEDGATIWIAYGACVGTLVYFGLFIGVIIKFLIRFEERILDFFRGLL
ncbi:MAG: exopolysaccharide biosynthesis protein [Verrucomicrobiales bacterium]|nr:exopolysaccharide biosynthesis protein [Verrucomicrobiales bacterium]